MQTKIEGLVISKISFKEKDLIVKLLLRNGKKISILFHSGRGGSKRKISSFIELGFMLKVELSRQNRLSDLYVAREWSLIWAHEKIRDNHTAFYLMCFYLEIFNCLSIEENLHDQNRMMEEDTHGHFKVASNALFYLEKSVAANQFNKGMQAIFFLGKLLFELGVYPDQKSCVLCGEKLEVSKRPNLIFMHGGFACDLCGSGDDKELYDLLWKIPRMKYADIDMIIVKTTGIINQLTNYFCYSFQLSQNDFKSLKLIL